MITMLLLIVFTLYMLQLVSTVATVVVSETLPLQGQGYEK